MLVYIVYNTNVNAVYAVYESESDANNTKDSICLLYTSDAADE